jgi:hypothetical protein
MQKESEVYAMSLVPVLEITSHGLLNDGELIRDNSPKVAVF